MENNRQIKRLKRTIIICMLVFCAVFAVSIFSFVQIGNLKRQNAKADEYISALQNQKQNLEQNLDKFKGDNYIDAVARENLDMIKENEIIYYFE